MAMEISFPAMAGRMGGRDYYVAMVPLNVLPKMFKFTDWGGMPPEQRAQRALQKSRVPEIAQYILDNEDGYLFSAITASYDCEPTFEAARGSNQMGTLTLPFDADLVINDGQHRRAAIEEALKENPTIGTDSIAVVLFPMEGLERMQQMFSDLNRTARKTSKSLDILYNHRDLLGQITQDVINKVPAFTNWVDRDRVSLPQKSPKLFTLSAIFDANSTLLGGSVVDADFDEKFLRSLEFWQGVAENMPTWQAVVSGDLKPSELRQEFISTHAVALWGLGEMGKTLLSLHPDDWQGRLPLLKKVDWRRTNKEWQGVAISGSDVVNRRQSRTDTGAFLKVKMGLKLTPGEERSLKGATDITSITDALKAFVGTEGDEDL